LHVYAADRNETAAGPSARQARLSELQCARDELMLDLSAKPAPVRAALYRQLAAKLRDVAAANDTDAQLRSEYMQLARQYDAMAANIWSADNYLQYSEK
jgi:hypothetical protein